VLSAIGRACLDAAARAFGGPADARAHEANSTAGHAGLKRAKAQGVRLGRGNRKDGTRSADEERWGMTRAELEKRVLRLHKDGMGVLKIGKTLGVATALVQGIVRPFDAVAA
jgi:hypothetical protein